MMNLQQIAQLKKLVTEGYTPSELMAYGTSKEELLALITTGDLPNFGDPELWPYIISQKPRMEASWPRQHCRAITQAKEACDLGKGNLTFGYKSPDILVMYLFPLRTRAYRKPWFFGDMGVGR